MHIYFKDDRLRSHWVKDLTGPCLYICQHAPTTHVGITCTCVGKGTWAVGCDKERPKHVTTKPSPIYNYYCKWHTFSTLNMAGACANVCNFASILYAFHSTYIWSIISIPFQWLIFPFKAMELLLHEMMWNLFRLSVLPYSHKSFSLTLLLEGFFQCLVWYDRNDWWTVLENIISNWKKMREYSRG